MSEADRPGNGGSDEPGRPARLRVYRGGRARGERTAPATPREVARRLSALERRVEEALARASGVRSDIGRDVLRAAADQALAALAGVRRVRLRDARAVLLRWSASLDALERDATEAVLEGLYRYWWRVEAIGLDRVPASGRVVLVANRSGALWPYEAFMIRMALADGRRARPLVDDWVRQLPVLGSALTRAGAVRAAPGNMRRLLEQDEALVVCPEPEAAKRFRDRYRLGRFGRGTFARLAIETRAPIVPVAVIGAEETHPVLARVDLAGRLLGLPTLPVTPTFPWLGFAGLVPLPTKWTLLIGEPLDVRSRHAATDASNPAIVGRLRDQVRERLQALVLEGRRRRRGIFFG